MSKNDHHTPTMTAEQPAYLTEPTAIDSSMDDDISRRTVVKTTAIATGSLLAGAGISTTVAAQETTFEFGGEVAGWQGRSPSSIEGQTNPSLELEAGQEYEIVWENLDGAPHNVVIEDADGNNLVRTELISEQGATQSVTFTASEEMAEYYCEVHPQSMRGDVSVSGAATETETETPAETETETATEAPTETPPETTPATETPTETTAGTPSDDEGPLMADEACPENRTETPEHKNDTCAKEDSKTGEDGEEETEADFDQLVRLLIRLLRRLLGGQ